MQKNEKLREQSQRGAGGGNLRRAIKRSPNEEHASEDDESRWARQEVSFTGVDGIEMAVRSTSTCATRSRTEGSARLSSEVADAGWAEAPSDASYRRQGPGRRGGTRVESYGGRTPLVTAAHAACDSS